MTFQEFKELPVVKEMIEEILKHDVDNNIVSIALPYYHLSPEHVVAYSDNTIKICIFYEKFSTEHDELFNFLSDYEEKRRHVSNCFQLIEEPANAIDTTACYPIYTTGKNEHPCCSNYFNPETFDNNAF